MVNYLYKISTKRKDVWSSDLPKPVYFVTTDKQSAENWATKNLSSGLIVSRITLVAEQVGGSVFVS